nr:phenylacetate degradation enoyl-CoA hydratase PaaA [Raoultella sp. NCTC 9187]
MSELLMSRHERVLHLTLNRPQARNALNNALLTLLAEALGSRGGRSGRERLRD